MDVWEDERQQSNLDGDEVMVVVSSNITRILRLSYTNGIHNDIARAI